MCSEAFLSRSTSNGHVFLQETKKTWAPVGVVVIDHEEEKVADEQFIRLAELTKVIKSSKNRRLIWREAKIRLSRYDFVSLQRG